MFRAELYSSITIVSHLFTYANQENPLSEENILNIKKLLPLLNKLNELIIQENIIHKEAGKLCKEKLCYTAKSIDVNMTIDGRKNSLLLFAVSNNHNEYVSELIKAGVNINQTSGDEWPPLSFAIKKGNLSMISLLLTHGAKIACPGDIKMEGNTYEDLLRFLKTCDKTDPDVLISLQVLCRQYSQFLEANEYLKHIQKHNDEISKQLISVTKYASTPVLFQNVESTKTRSNGKDKVEDEKDSKHLYTQ